MDKMKICRACLAEGEPMLSLFEPYEHELSLAVILQSCMAIEVYPGDNLPAYLCDKCIQILTQFYNFTIIYEQSDQRLRQLKHEPHSELEEQQSLNDQDDIVLNERGLEYLHRNKRSSRYNDTADVNDNRAVVISNIEDYEYVDVKDAGILMHQGGVGYITLDAIKSEHLELEVCDSYSGQEVQTISKPNKIVISDNTAFEEIVKYECSLCGEEHLYLTAFRNHMRVKHAIFQVSPEDYSSTVRIKVSQSEPEVNELTQAHEEILSSEPLIKCEICSKKFHFQAQLNKHVKLHQLGKKFICEVCGAGFIRKTYLDDHKEGHSTERKHACPFCNKKFRRRTVLRAHKRSHTHRNHYVCELCGRAFTGKGTLRTHHLLIHVRERNFTCKICLQKFPLKSTLNKHVIRHEKREKGEKGFNCTQCEMEYRDKSSLKRHVEVKHLGNVVLVPCPDCPKEYTSNANLQKHRKRHHPTEIEAF